MLWSTDMKIPMNNEQHIEVSIGGQKLSFFQDGRKVVRYSISTSSKGAGEKRGSWQTPRGLHRIRAKIGAGLPENAVLVGRRFSGEIYDQDLAQKFPQRDWVLTRILWLCGREHGINRMGAVDSMRRFIYIHGTPDTEPMGLPRSHGCIRMRNSEILELFEKVTPGCPVTILE